MLNQFPELLPACRAVVAIPACNEAERIGPCLAALATQRDANGAPLDEKFGVLVFANNCRDDTAAQARAWGPLCPFPLAVVEDRLAPARSNAGWARKSVMDLAADWLRPMRGGVLLTTDADSRVCSTWIARTLALIEGGVDAVAGYIEAEPVEWLSIGRGFQERGRLEDAYLALIAEVAALCDPQPHDPWPNHRVHSGASFALTRAAYAAIGGLPPIALGEDAALADALVDAGFKIRHPLDVVVTTSCRLEGRAPGGAADTMRLRRDEPDAPCDSDMAPAADVVRRFVWRGRLRSWYAGARADLSWSSRLRLDPAGLATLARQSHGFEAFWRIVERESRVLRRGPPLRPSRLPAEIALARRAVTRLRRITRALAPGDRPR